MRADRDIDDEDESMLPVADVRLVSPGALAARLALVRALPSRLRGPIERGASTCYVIVVPGAAWCRPTLKAAAEIFGVGEDVEFDAVRTWPRHVGADRVYFVRDGTERTMGRPDRSADFVPAFVGAGGAVVGIAADVGLLPKYVVAAADRSIRVSPLSPRDLASVVRTVTKGTRVPRIDRSLASSLDPQEIALAVRAYTTPSSCLGRMRRLVEMRSSVSAADVPPLECLAGYGEAHVWGMDLVRDLEAFRADPTSISVTSLTRSVLLAGPPGTGKTLFASALAKSLRVPLVVTGYADWQTTGSGYLNDVMSAMRGAFDEARRAAQASGEIALLFIDELDSVPDRRAVGDDRHASWWTTVVNALLTCTELQSPARRGVVLIGATNYPENIDAALLRSGRFDRTIRLRLPGPADVAAILRTHLGTDLAEVDLAPLAAIAPPATGADVARWVREARSVARARGEPMTLDDVAAQALPPDKRTSAFVMSTALHEAAHAVVALRTGHDRLVSVSVVGGPQNLGCTLFEADPNVSLSRDYVETRIVARLAGRAADAFFGRADAGSFSDLVSATEQIAAVHFSFGLGDNVASWGDLADVMVLLRTDAEMRAVVEADARRLYGRAAALVAKHAAEIGAVARELVAKRVLNAHEVTALLGGSSARRFRSGAKRRGATDGTNGP